MEAEHCPDCTGLMDYKFTSSDTKEHLYYCPACKKHYWVVIK